MPARNKPEEHTEEHDGTVNQNAVVHFLDRRVQPRWPHGPEGAKYGIDNGYDGDRDAETAEPEGAPRDLGCGRGQALVQHDGCGEDEGGVVAGDDERDEGAEANGRADVYEGEK